MGTRIVELEGIGRRDLDAWRELARRSADPNPFFEPEFVLPASRHLGLRKAFLLVVEEGGSWHACLPVERRGRRPLAALSAWHHPYSFLGTPLVDAARPGAAERLADVLSERQASLLRIEKLGSDDVANELRHGLGERRFRFAVRERHERAALRRGTSRPQATGKVRSDLRRRRRKLEQALEAPVAIVDRADDPSAWSEFLQLERSGWKGRNGTALESDPAHAAFFRDVCEAFSEAGRLQLLALGSDSRSVAMSCNIAGGDVLFCFKIAFDEQFRKLAPGVQLVHANADVFLDERSERLMDSCAEPTNELLNRSWPDRITVSTVVVSRADLPGSASVLAMRGLRAAGARLDPVRLRGRLGAPSG